MKTRILLTGASGTIGREVLKQLCEQNSVYEITVFGRKSTRSIAILKPFRDKINVVYGNINNNSDLIKVCSNKDVVIHLLAILPPRADRKPEVAYKINVLGTENLIRCLELNSPNAFFLYSSSIAVYGDRLNDPFISVNDKLNPSPGDEYAKTKIQAESIIQNSKIDWTIFRLTVIMGGHKVSKIMFRQPLETSLEIATPEDTVRAFINAIEKKEQLSKKIFNLGGGANCRTTYYQFLSRSFDIYGLGKLNFAPKSFAQKNFSCGFYQDGDLLESILNFRNDTLDSYFAKERNKVSPLKRSAISIIKKPIKFYLQRLSEPLAAYVKQDKELMKQFFNS